MKGVIFMFYEDFCITDNQKLVFNALMSTYRSHERCSIQELDYLGLARTDLVEVLEYFQNHGLFEWVHRDVYGNLTFFALR